MAKPTNSDARLLIQLAAWHTESGVPEAMNWVRGDGFTSDYAEFDKLHPNGSEGRLHVNRILGYYETVGTLWRNRLLHEGLLFDWLWVPGPWDLVKPIALGIREQFGNVGIWENFEAMAERQRSLATDVAASSAAKKAPAAKKARTPSTRATASKKKR